MSKRKDTCLGKVCPFWKRYGEYCPNYVTGEWKTNEGIGYDTKDCAPKRSMILTQQIYDQIILGRKDSNQARNANMIALKYLVNHVENEKPQISIMDADIEDTKLIEE